MSMILPMILSVLPYFLWASSIGLNLLLFFILEQELSTDRRRFRAHVAAEEGRSATKRPEPRPDPPPLPAASESPQARRARILIRSKKGEQPSEIAAALGIPIHEVSLVLKVAQATRAASA